MLPILLQSIPVPVSAYALCFVPLATVVIGLFAFFALTDRHANRPYLRYNAFRAVATPSAAQAARGLAQGETPAGSLGGTEGGTTTVYGGGGEIGAVAEVSNTGSPAVKEATVAAGAEQEQTIVAATGQAEQARARAEQAASLPPAEADAAAHPMASADVELNSSPLARPVSVPVRATEVSGLRLAEVGYQPTSGAATDEFVRLVNDSSQEIDLTGWTLRDDGRKHAFMFPAFVLAPGAEVRVWSRGGTNNAGNLFWNNAGAVWNNAGDTVVLEDLSGTIVGRLSYQGNR